MKVILLKDVANLGDEGDICTVKGGFARNFLIPRQCALPFSRHAESLLRGKKRILTERKEEKRRIALDLDERIRDLRIEVSARASETGKLFGSVTATVIAEFFESEGIPVDKWHIELPHKHIREVGSYPVKIKLYENQSTQCMLQVVASDEDAAMRVAPVKEEESSEVAQEETVSENSMHDDEAQTHSSKEAEEG